MYRITAASVHKKLNDLFKKRLAKYTGYCALTTSPNPLPSDTVNNTPNKFENEEQKLAQLFPRSEEFPARHIGPREQEQTQMLELLGFRVSWQNFNYSEEK